MTRRTDSDIAALLAFVTCALLLSFDVSAQAPPQPTLRWKELQAQTQAQSRRRPTSPTLAETMYRSMFLVRTDLVGVGRVGTDRYLWIFVDPNPDIESPLNDETRNGVNPLGLWRVRRVKSTTDNSTRLMFCKFYSFDVQSLDHDQRFRIDRSKLLLPLRDDDELAIEWRPWWIISTSVDPDGVTCSVCGYYRRVMLAMPGSGYIAPNASCQ